VAAAAEVIDLPLREHSRLLLAAGFAPVFGERSPDEREMAPVRRSVAAKDGRARRKWFNQAVESRLPAGTVTLLFTDVEGSTRLLQELGEDYTDVLAEHRRALRGAFARHGGVEVGTE